MSKHGFLVVVVLLVLILPSCQSTNEVLNEVASVNIYEFRGAVTDEETSEPLSGAQVMLEGTSFKTSTNELGEFSLNIPKGFYEVIVTQDGYRSMRRLVGFESATSQTFRLFNKSVVNSFSTKQEEPASIESLSKRVRYLEQKTDSLEKLVNSLKSSIRAQSDDSRLDKFADYYIGDAPGCDVLNPGDIKFADSDEPGVISIDEPVELIMENYNTGYRVIIKLNDFHAKDYGRVVRTNVDADYFFEELTAENNNQREKWKRNRQELFEGSFQHLLVALASEKPPIYFGYRFYSGNNVESVSGLGFTSSTVQDREVKKEYFVKKKPDKNLLEFDGEIRVEYIRKGVDDPNSIMGLSKYLNQTSWITLNKESIEFSENGMLKDKDALEIQGVWNYTTVCKMLPRDYIPPS